MVRTCTLALEALEQRCVPTGNVVNLQGGILNILTRADLAHSAVVSQTAEGVRVDLDGASYNFTGAVNRIFYQGGARTDEFRNATSIAATVQGGGGNDILLGGVGDDVIDGGSGDNFIQDDNGVNILTAGNGNNNVYGGLGNDTIALGRGFNVVYDIVGVNTVSVARDSLLELDYLFVNAQSQVLGATSFDTVVRFFAPGRTPGAGSLVLEDGVLYFTGNNNGNRYEFNVVGSNLVVTYDLNDGAGEQTATFRRSDVRFLAGFGGSGNDVIRNNTAIGIVAYGANGNDTVVGGFGFNLLKGGGGDDTVEGRGLYNDLTGNGGADTLKGRNGFLNLNIFRTDANDTIVNSRSRDLFIGTRPSQGG